MFAGLSIATNIMLMARKFLEAAGECIRCVHDKGLIGRKHGRR
jgi:hypothetical protein